MRDTAMANLEKLGQNPYPGRGMVVGLDELGRGVQVYWIMGRSENSRNRVFSAEGGRLFTEAADPAKVTDPSLIIYNAMRDFRSDRCRGSVVSNGDQTDSAAQVLELGDSFHDSLVAWEYEPDAPNFTPRITALVRSCSPVVEMSIIRKLPGSRLCERHFYEYEDVPRGIGYCLTTYSGDGNPLPAFTGEPYVLPLEGGSREIAEAYWLSLNPQNRVAVAVKVTDFSGESEMEILNHFAK